MNLRFDRVREFTALFPVRPERQSSGSGVASPTFRAALAGLKGEDLSGVTTLHAARWVVIDDLEGDVPGRPQHERLASPYLLFASTYDGELDTHLEQLAVVQEDVVKTIWGHCWGFPAPFTPAAFRDYAKSCRTRSSFFLRDRDRSAEFVGRALAVRNDFVDFVVAHQQSSAEELTADFREFAREREIALPVLPHPLESPPKGELRDIRRTVDLARRRLVRDYFAARAEDPDVLALRGAHAKHHGCVKGTFIVREDVPEELRRGVFARPGTYEATIRFSNGAESVRPDRKGDGRGMAIKLHGVRGDPAIDLDLVREKGTMDLLLVNSRTFFVQDVKTYKTFRRLRDLGGLGSVLAILYLFARPRQGSTLLRLLREKVYDPLGIEYHSMTAHLCGDQVACKLSARPLEPVGSGPRDSDDYLREAMARRLDPESGRGAAFESAVDVLDGTDAVEDPTRPWKGRSVRHVVAKIDIPVQDFGTPEREQECERLAFNPWNVPKEHRPLGGLNRARLAVYLATSRLRNALDSGSIA